ncbi:hypothetical protein [Nonlabens ulvanivorans]|uniref:hypothetical protein n=1 Tax=Nonlabens ulvanivorans TaxID=906888 RepID=UPI0029437984|nr:hypothetical protein [Nonlabens ulvanivorans]WOI22697.1 hypothetical protein R1T42_13625 [Nonlabens ulvanivorans]
MKESIDLIWKTLKNYYWLLVIPVFVFLYFKTLQNERELDNSFKFTFARVNYTSSVYKKYSKRSYHYEFFVEGKKYVGSSSAYISDDIKIGNFYQVKFASNDPGNNKIDFTTQYYQIISGFESKKIDTSYIEVSKYKVDSVDLKNRFNRVKALIEN